MVATESTAAHELDDQTGQLASHEDTAAFDLSAPGHYLVPAPTACAFTFQYDLVVLWLLWVVCEATGQRGQ